MKNIYQIKKKDQENQKHKKESKKINQWETKRRRKRKKTGWKEYPTKVE